MLPIIKKHISMNYYVGQTMQPQYVVIHETDNRSPGANALAHFNYWNTNSAAQASTHFVVDDHNIVQMLELNEKAWHVGDNKGYSDITNSNAIGIETCDNSDGNYTIARQNTIELTAYILKVLGFGIDKLKRHYDASGKLCPSTMIQNPALWTDFVNQVAAILNGKPIQPVQPKGYISMGDSGKPVSDLQNKLIIIGYLPAGSADGQFGPMTDATVKKFQANTGLVVDGKVGDATWTMIDKKINDKNNQPFPGLMSIGSKGSAVVDLQNKLIHLNYLPAGSADGQYGQQTANAVLNFQKANGLSADGKVGPQTWSVLIKK